MERERFQIIFLYKKIINKYKKEKNEEWKKKKQKP